MNMLSTWVARRRRRRMFRKYAHKLVAGVNRRVAMAREMNEIDFAAALTDYAVMLGRTAEGLSLKEKQQAMLNHILEKQE